uniref:Inositol-tetrakisphosphate 1-kinase N-terminal domain-containing protein n=1 Tax=Romanomermis culicivorax TaxID=13658 RepID=A0A915HR47_ROMCU
MSKTLNCSPKAYRWRVGYWISEKKLKKMNFDEFTTVARSANIELIKINLDDDLEVQGPYDAILHKLSDLLVLSDQGDSNASNLVGKLEKFLQDHPEIVVLDPFDCVRKLCDRYQQYTLIQDVCEIGRLRVPGTEYERNRFIFQELDLEPNLQISQEPALELIDC